MVIKQVELSMAPEEAAIMKEAILKCSHMGKANYQILEHLLVQNKQIDFQYFKKNFTRHLIININNDSFIIFPNLENLSTMKKYDWSRNDR